ncbi:hypothetical protein [Nostoc sp. CCY0012]|uniref:hypothetical protein n=1 Tax=Nostoc sp. CCY0012 TaxID=1056123 RepID=UPI0039C6467E
MRVDVDSKIPYYTWFSFKVLGILLLASVFASMGTILYGLIIAHQVVSLPEVFLFAGQHYFGVLM